MKTKFAVAPLAVIAVLAAGCADSPVAPARTLVNAHIPSLDVSTIPADPSLGIPLRPAGVQPGEVRVCKATPAGDPALSWQFTVVATNEDGSAGPVVPQSPVTIQGVSGQTVCATVNGNPWVFKSAKDGRSLDKITITEVGPLPTDWALTHIHVELYKDGNLYDPADAGSNALVVNGDLNTRSVTFYVNDDMQRFVTFTNDYTATEVLEGCTYTKGWYQNKNGAPTVIAVDGLSISEAQQIFAATPGKPGNVKFSGNNSLLNLYQQFLAALQNLGGDLNEHDGPDAVDAAIDAVRGGTDATGMNITTTLTKAQISQYTGVLAGFNEGDYKGWPHCD